jgi:ABC-type amino acid transport substrate-binding protein
MKKFLLLILLAIVTFGCKSQNEKIRIFVAWPGAEYLPSYKWNIGDDKPKGVEPVLIERILSKAGYDYEFVRDYNYHKNGDVRIDVIADKKADVSIRSITINDKRKEKVNFSEPYFYDGLSAMVIDPNIRSIEEFKGKTVFAAKNTTAYKWATKNLPNSKIVSFEDFDDKQSSPEVFLAQNKIEILLADRTFLQNCSKRNKRFIVLKEKYTEEPFGIAVAKTKTKLLKNINKAISDLKNTGELYKLTSEFD